MTCEEKTFVTDDGVNVFYRKYTAKPQRAVIFFCHGFGEHSGRYDAAFANFQANGISVLSPDHRGHGKTVDLNPGMRKGEGNIEAMFAGYLKLLKVVEKDLVGDSPVIVFGHSMGGLFAIRFSQVHWRDIPNFAGCAASAPALGFVVNFVTYNVLMTLAYWLPSVIIGAPLSKEVSNDPAVVEAYFADPLVHDRIQLGFARSMDETIKAVHRDAAATKFPILITGSAADKLVPWQPILDFVANVGSKDKEFQHWEGHAHEAHNDIGKEKVISKWTEWSVARAAAGPWKGPDAEARL
ncbi:Alpha/Beta hydrolase protein [Hyaloraphidium curvatum]|nr:Alpha/Beta hydrolase protein [Hyaloraphidium curvatum]